MAAAAEVVLEMEALVKSMEKEMQVELESYQPINTPISIQRLHSKVPLEIREKQWFLDPFIPKLVSIGPYHVGKEELQPMQKCKWVFLDTLLARASGKHLRDCIRVVCGVQEKTRQCYTGEFALQLDEDAFIRMLVLDSCFLIEFSFQLLAVWRGIADTDSLLLRDRIDFPKLWTDLVMFENQVPFGVLQAIYDVLFDTTSLPFGLNLFECLREAFFSNKKWQPDHLHFTYNILFMCYNSSIVKSSHPTALELSFWRKVRIVFSRVTNFILSPCFNLLSFTSDDLPFPTATAATELKEYGITFKSYSAIHEFGDISFVNGVVFLPRIKLNHSEYALIMNFIVLERVVYEIYMPQLVSCRVDFLCTLITSMGDYKVLQDKNILFAPNADDVLIFFDQFRKLTKYDNHLDPMTKNVKKSMYDYIKQPQHRWRAKLVKDHFNTPWSILGWTIGFMLLALTLLQTLFTMIAYYHPKE